MDGIEEILAEAAAVVRAVAGDELSRPPGSDAGPVYIVPDTWHASLRSRLDDVGACAATGWYADIALRELLESRDLWRGPGFACVVSISELNGLHGGDRRRRAAVGHVLHEFAHWIAYGAGPAAMETCGAPWDGHGMPFIRAAIYSTWLCRDRYDPRFSAEDLGVAGDRYGLSHADRYEQAMSGHYELARLAPLRELLGQVEAPARCRELFEADAAAWYRRQR
jgi:hypothetical protein